MKYRIIPVQTQRSGKFDPAGWPAPRIVRNKFTIAVMTENSNATVATTAAICRLKEIGLNKKYRTPLKGQKNASPQKPIRDKRRLQIGLPVMSGTKK